MNRRTGVLSVTTAIGAGEVRMADGEVLDAVYRRLEGEKALYRLLGEREGTFAFVPGRYDIAPAGRAGNADARHGGDAPVRRGRALRQELAPGGDALIATELSSDSDPPSSSERS